ncbi:hypothetical protein B484DRAFT_437700, partial [Ochromonadaceae sp. CCMP2298]
LGLEDADMEDVWEGADMRSDEGNAKDATPEELRGLLAAAAANSVPASAPAPAPVDENTAVTHAAATNPPAKPAVAAANKSKAVTKSKPKPKPTTATKPKAVRAPVYRQCNAIGRCLGSHGGMQIAQHGGRDLDGAWLCGACVQKEGEQVAALQNGKRLHKRKREND